MTPEERQKRRDKVAFEAANSLRMWKYMKNRFEGKTADEIHEYLTNEQSILPSDRNVIGETVEGKVKFRFANDKEQDDIDKKFEANLKDINSRYKEAFKIQIKKEK